MKLNRKIYLSFFFSVWMSLALLAQNNRNGYPSVQHLPPEVNFSWTGACAGDTTFFINETIRGDFFQWYVLKGDPDGGPMDTLYSSTDTNIAYVFNPPGTYFVYLQGNNGHLVDIKLLVSIDSVTTADFDFQHCINHFVNHSTCASSFFWDFGDGATSTLELPVHEYADSGHYNVTLIACKGPVCDTMSKKIWVSTTRYPHADYTYYKLHDTLFVHGSDTTPGMLYNWSWGDSNFDIGRSQKHFYADTLAWHTVTLLARNACQNKYKTDTIYRHDPVPVTGPTLSFANSSLLVFPSPAVSNTDLTLYFNSSEKGVARVSMCDALGQILYENDYSFNVGVNTFKINADDLADGVYFILLQKDLDATRVKFLVSRQP